MYYLFLHLYVSPQKKKKKRREKSKMWSGSNNGDTRDKIVVCTLWCEVFVYFICKHLYFSCENVDIYENVNIRSIEPVLPVL